MKPEIETYSFSAALELIKLGKKMACLSWNGKNQWVTAQYPDEYSKTKLLYLRKPFEVGMFIAKQYFGKD